MIFFPDLPPQDAQKGPSSQGRVLLHTYSGPSLLLSLSVLSGELSLPLRTVDPCKFISISTSHETFFGEMLQEA